MKHVHRSYDQQSATIPFPSATTRSPHPSGDVPRPSGRPAQPSAVLHHLVRPRASLRAGLAEPQLRRIPRRRPRPVTHMMTGIWVVLVPVTPFPAAICPGELRTAERADLLAGLGQCHGELIICHLRDPLRRCSPCGRPGVVAAAAPVAGRTRSRQPTPATRRAVACRARARAAVRSRSRRPKGNA